MLYVLGDPTRLGEDFWQRALHALSAQRREKVLRFRFARDRTISAAVYLLLRLGLSQNFGISDMPEFLLESQGKPRLPSDGPHFSLSQCHRAVVCALHTEPVGVDVERWDAFAPNQMGADLRARMFSPQEQAEIQGAPDRDQVACALWTMRESMAKYTGEGLRGGLSDALPPALCLVDMHHDVYHFANFGVTVSLCRRATPDGTPLPCREITPEDMTRFLAFIVYTKKVIC